MRNPVRTTITYVLLILLTVLVLTPLFWVVSASFKPSGEIFSYPPTFLPQDPTLENFTRLFQEMPIIQYVVNSTFLATSHTLLLLAIATMGGFAFAKYSFRGRGILFAIVLASMMIPFHLVLVPLFTLLYQFGWLDTYQGVILPYLASSGFGVFLMRQFILGVPSDLLDAARIDGTSEFGIYWRVIIPAVKPAMGALSIFGFLGAWNEFLWPMIVLRDAAKYTLPLGLASLVGVYRQEYGMLMAGTLLSILPIMALFLAMQREFVQGITLGAVKE
ncbi:MAG: carbohydrate ABC transporter permease [Gemmatimonadota bacterium]|nr:carbohydrate ABC transporter permease [Gemmatimonadota bacterium]MDE2847470.1 carbohydrate ABC transporter permease [Gemmatimonadota bacterium]